MKHFVEVIVFILVFVLIGLNYQKNEKQISLIETERIVKATFQPSLEYPNTTCFSLEGSKRSFFNPNNYNESTVFKIVEAKINGENCIRKILANNDVLLQKDSLQGCIKYEIPDTYCHGGKHCTAVRDHCY